MIWCVEDDASIRDIEVYTLTSTGFEAKGFPDGASFREARKEDKPELVLMDVMLPGEDGITILKRLRADQSGPQVPVMMLTARGAEYDKVLGLDAGADDYLAKPFGMMELVSRVKALLRRSTAYSSGEKQNALTCGPIRLEEESRRVSVEGKETAITRKEFDLLCLLMKHPSVVLTRDRLMAEVWGTDFEGESRTVDVHIGTLRQKLGPAGSMIETVRGVGYRMEAPQQ